MPSSCTGMELIGTVAFGEIPGDNHQRRLASPNQSVHGGRHPSRAEAQPKALKRLRRLALCSAK